MDQFGALPLTVAAFEVRLRRGEVFTVQGPDGVAFALSLEGERFVLRQGGIAHPFRQLEPALLTLLHGLGVFGRPDLSRRVPGGPETSAVGGVFSGVDARVDPRLRRIFAEQAQIEESQVRLESTFESLGMDRGSVHAMVAGMELLEVIERVEEVFQVSVIMEEMPGDSVWDFQDYLKGKGVL